MSLELIRQNITGLQAAMAALEAETQTQSKIRASSRKAKNLTPGDIVQWPYSDEMVEINGWGMVGSRVTVCRLNGRIATFDSEERVKVYRA